MQKKGSLVWASHFFLMEENMKEGMQLNELAKELISIRDNKVDIIVPSKLLHMTPEANLDVDGKDTFQLNNWTHSQLGSYSKIPKGYYDKLHIEAPHILAQCVNHGIQMAINNSISARKSKSESRLVRTLNGNVRGFLSSRYRMLDCVDLLETTLPILTENNFELVSSELTDKKMYIKVTTPKLQGEIKKGMVVQYGLVISSSDVGCGSVRVEPLIYELVCSNGMICNTSMRKFHIGKDNASAEIERMLSNETKKMDDEVFWAKCRDLIKGSMEEINFRREIELLKEANEIKIGRVSNLESVVEDTMKVVGVSGEKKKHSILEHIASGSMGRGYTKYGLANAFTWASHKVEDASYEEATELERAGGKIISMSDAVWKNVAC
jgi:hypothetical protein